jgi:hypothetical protein
VDRFSPLLLGGNMVFFRREFHPQPLIPCPRTFIIGTQNAQDELLTRK